MPSSEHDSLWYAVYQVHDGKSRHTGSYHIDLSRDDDGHRVQDHRIRIHGAGLDHEAHCRLVLERKAGRFVPVHLDYDEPNRESSIRFEEGRIHGSGAAADHEGSAVPDDAMPTYGIALLAQTIFDKPEASLSFDALVDATGAMCGADAKLVARGQTDDTPFPADAKLWEVVWLSNEGTRIQAFYFTDEGTLAQADWGDTRARLVNGKEEATPIPTEAAEES